MRQLVVDQLSREEWHNLESYLKRTLRPGPMIGLFWLELPPALWSREQQAHAQCAPFQFAVDLSEKRLVCELLVRGSGRLHCNCAGYADLGQRVFLLQFWDTMLSEELIKA